MGGEAFKRKLVHSVAITIMALNNFVPLLKSFTANVLKCAASLKTKVECAPLLWAFNNVFNYVTMCSLVMSPFSHDFK